MINNNVDALLQSELWCSSKYPYPPRRATEIAVGGGVVQKEAISKEVGGGGGVSYGELFPGARSKIGELSKLSVI